MLKQSVKKTSWWRAFSFVAVLLAMAHGGCDADPMPSPGAPDRFKIFITAGVVKPGSPLDLVGLIGLKYTVVGPGVVVLRTPTTTVYATASHDGSFAGTIAAAPGDRIEVAYRETMGGPESIPVALTVPSYDESRAPPLPSTDPAIGTINTEPAVTASVPDAKGNTLITGQLLGTNVFVTLGNLRTGDVLDVQAAKDGSLSTMLPAISGDNILVIVRDPATGLTTPEATLLVPSP